uniref:C-C motif chemokine ligand 28 n=1 Tax=Ovis aries TaxID=9940 RepID=A0AC11ELS1_SHEEP
ELPVKFYVGQYEDCTLGDSTSDGSEKLFQRAILPIASSCCTEVSHHVSRRLLERVTTCRIQRADGDCDLAAVILHVKRRRVCVSPHNHVIKQWMKEQAAKKQAQGNVCHKKRHHARRNSKGPHRERQEAHGHKTPY